MKSLMNILVSLGLKLSVTSIEKEEENPEKPLKIEHDASVTNLIYS